MKTDRQLLRELAQAAEGLLYLSESDYPFETLCLEGSGELTPDRLRSLAGASTDAPVEVRSLEDFFRPNAVVVARKDKERFATAGSYQTMVRLLKENLEEPRVYKVGRINLSVFIVGRSRKGNWLGLRTRVVET